MSTMPVHGTMPATSASGAPLTMPVSQGNVAVGRPPVVQQAPGEVRPMPYVNTTAGAPPTVMHGHPPAATSPPPSLMTGFPQSVSRPPLVANSQPPVGRPPSQAPVGRPSSQMPVGRPPSQMPVGRPPSQAPVGRPTNQMPVGRPPSQAPVGRPTNQVPVGRPLSQAPVGRSANQVPVGRPPAPSATNKPPHQTEMVPQTSHGPVHSPQSMSPTTANSLDASLPLSPTEENLPLVMPISRSVGSVAENAEDQREAEKRAAIKAPAELGAAARYVCEVYEYFARTGVPGDGAIEGIEYTHFPAPPPWENPPPPSDARVRSTDPFGFYDAKAMYRHKEPRIIPDADTMTPLLTAHGARVPKFRLHHFSSDNVEEGLAKRARGQILPRAQVVRRERKWDGLLEAGIGGPLRMIRQHVYKGIPESRRGEAWIALAARRAPRVPPSSVFDTLKEPSLYDMQIDLDVPRTISGHVRFLTRYGRGQRELFSVLHARSLACDECGYCQGMAAPVVILLLHMSVMRANALLSTLHDTYELHDYYRPKFPGLQDDFFVLRRVVQLTAPRISHLLESANIMPSAFATSWFMTLFANVLPYSTQLRVWDAFLLDGRDLIIIVAAAIVRSLEGRVATAEDALEQLSKPVVPPSDDHFMAWVESTITNSRIQRCIRRARETWAARVADGFSEEEEIDGSDGEVPYPSYADDAGSLDEHIEE